MLFTSSETSPQVATRSGPYLKAIRRVAFYERLQWKALHVVDFDYWWTVETYREQWPAWVSKMRSWLIN